jgi:hypothetical protein
MARSASSVIARIDAEKSKPPNLAPWASLANEVFKGTSSDLRLIGGGAFSASEKKATLQALEVGLRNSGASKVASGTLALKTFYNFDDGAGTLLFQLTVRRTVYAVQIERLPDGPSNAYVGRTDPYVLVATPPITPVDGLRVGNELEKALNLGDITLGPVNQLAIGDALAAKLIAAGFPNSAFDVSVSFGPRETGNNGYSLSLFGTVSPNIGAQGNVYTDYYFQMSIQSDGTYTVNVFYPYAPQEPLLPVSDPQYLPYAGFTSSPFYFPYTFLANT